jgi:xanthine dehydrogenase accessory factor
MTDLLEWAAEKKREGVALCLVTVVESAGSVPAPVGARLVVTPDSTRGTVGGGALEKFATDEARALLETGGEPRLIRRRTAELDMRCGGEVALFFEPLSTARRLWIFGGGHIATALAPIAAKLGFAITVVDERPEFARDERFPAASRVICGDPAERAQGVDPSSFAVIVTHGHAHDQGVLEQLVQIDPPLAYIGMIGSVRKVRGALDALADNGLQPGPNLYAPIGLDVGGGSPSQIAVAIAAELLGVLHEKSDLPHCRNRLAVVGSREEGSR